MSETMGIGVLKTVVDNSQMATGIAQGVASLEKLEKAFEKAGDTADNSMGGIPGITDKVNESTVKLDATTKRFLASLEREGEQTGRLRSEYLELRAAKLGVTAQSEQYIARIRSAEQATDGLRKAASSTSTALRSMGDAEKTLNSFGQTAKQTTAALRNVPAQFTDIIVSLQGGQAPLTVLLQQGGQLKDMFNGAGNAAKALLGYIASLITPTTLVAGAIGVLAVAYYQGSKEQTSFNKNLILSGNYAGETSGQLMDMAAGFRELGVTQGAAAETLSAVVGTGRIAKGELALVAEATMNLTKVGGQDMKEALNNFIQLGDDPVKASAKLNESYNYLTQAVYEQIKALTEANRMDEAAALAQTAFANAVNERAAQVKSSLGTIERAFQGAISWAKQGWDAILGIGRDTSLKEKLDQVGKEIDSRMKEQWKLKSGSADNDPGLQKLRLQQSLLQDQMRTEQRMAEAQAQSAKDNKAGIGATDAVMRLQGQAKGVASVTDELKKYHAQLEQIRKTNPNSDLLSAENVAKGEQAIRKAHQGTQSKAKAVRDDEGTRYLQTLREQGAALEAQLGVDEKLTASQTARAKFEQLIADLKGKTILTADQKSLLANEEALRTQLKKNEATESEVVAAKEVAKFKKEQAEAEKRAYDAFIARVSNNSLTMASKQEGRSEEYGRSLGSMGMGDEQRAQVEAQKSIYKEYQRYRLDLDKATPGNMLGSDAYKDAVAEIQGNLASALAAHKTYYDDIKMMNADATVGQQAAIQNYIDSAANVAKGTAQMWTSGMQQAEDALVNFVQTGKLSFKSLANSIIADMIRIQARQAMSGLLNSLFGAAVSALGGGWSAAGAQASGAFTSAVTSSSAVGVPLAPMSDGGYTGDGGKYDPAAVVHRGEVVFSQEDVARNGGVAAVEALRKRGGRGFSSGGVVGGFGGGFAGGGGSIIIQNNGAPLEVQEKKTQENGQGGIDMVLIVRQIEGQMASNVQQGTGPMSKAIENRFGSKTAVR